MNAPYKLNAVVDVRLLTVPKRFVDLAFVHRVL